MPFESQAQRGYMYANHPKIAEEFEKKTPPGKLPYHKEASHLSSDIGPEAFHKEVEKRMKALALNPIVRGVEVDYKDHEIRTFPRFDKVAAQIDNYNLNEYYNSTQEAIKAAKDRIDKWGKF